MFRLEISNDFEIVDSFILICGRTELRGGCQLNLDTLDFGHYYSFLTSKTYAEADPRIETKLHSDKWTHMKADEPEEEKKKHRWVHLGSRMRCLWA